MNLKKMMIGSALLMAACCMQAQTKAIAHRGFWKTPGSSQNSITSIDSRSKEQLDKEWIEEIVVQNLMFGLLKTAS